jgi:hypothetical protein
LAAFLWRSVSLGQIGVGFWTGKLTHWRERPAASRSNPMTRLAYEPK